MIRATLRHHAKERLQERTSLEPAAFLHLLDQNLSVSVGVESYTRRRHRLLYSEADKAHFVAVQDFETGEVITLLPIDYHENLAWKLSEKSLRKAVWLVNPRLHQVLYGSSTTQAPGSKCQVTGVFFAERMDSRSHNLGRHRFERGFPESSEDAMADDCFIEKLLTKLQQKRLNLQFLEEIVLFENGSGAILKIPWDVIDGFGLDIGREEQGAAPDGGTATLPDNSGVTVGPPSRLQQTPSDERQVMGAAGPRGGLDRLATVPVERPGTRGCETP